MSSRLNIKVGERWLDVPRGTKLKITQVNNIFYESQSRRSFSLTANLPYSSRNNIALGWLYELGTPNSAAATVECGVYDDHTHVHNATLQVRKTARGYSVNVLIDHGALDALYSETNVRDIPALDFVQPGGATTGDWPSSTAVYYYQCLFGGFNGPADSRRMLFYYQHDALGAYLMHVLKEVMNYCGWQGNSLDGSFVSDTELQQLHFCNNWYDNDFDTGAISYSYLLPDITIGDLLKSLQVMFNIGYFFNNRTKKVSMVLLKDLLGNSPIDWSSKVPRHLVERNWGGKVIDGVKLRWSSEIYTMYQKPDLSQYAQIGYQDNDTYLYNTGSPNDLVRIVTENTAFVWKRPDWWTSAAEDWYPVAYLGSLTDYTGQTAIAPVNSYYDLPGSLPDEGTVCLVLNENWWYMVIDGDWHKWVYNNFGVEKGNARRELTSKIGAPIMDRIGDELENHNLRLVPVLNNHGTEYAILEGIAKSNLKNMPALLSFNRGRGTDSQGFQYYIGNINGDRLSNFSSADIYDWNFNQVGNYRLTWESDNGLYKTFHEPWYEFVNNGQEITFPANLTLLDLMNLDMQKPVHVHGVTGWIMQLEYELPLNGPVMVTMVKRS